MRISRTALSCLLRLKDYGAYPAGACGASGAPAGPRGREKLDEVSLALAAELLSVSRSSIAGASAVLNCRRGFWDWDPKLSVKYLIGRKSILQPWFDALRKAGLPEE